jgi:hypothetical protein
MSRMLIAVELLFFLELSLSSGPSGAVLTGRVAESAMSKDDIHWVLALPGADVTSSMHQDWPLPSATVRDCSLDRVLQTKANQDDSFRFADVLPGIYDLVAGGRGWAPITVPGVRVAHSAGVWTF